jgi:2,4-dienoyl-CoA reductase-like NADH-dependent reductase (Old Yellow Enzyme family)
MNAKDIRETVSAFADATARAVRAGADGVQLHAAHGYLLNQFLSPFFNRRKDDWGGSDENRFRFVGEVISAVRERMPKGMPLLVKLNTNDHTPGQGITPELAAVYAENLAKCGIDCLELSCGTSLYSFMNMCRGDVPVEDFVKGFPWWKKPVGRIMLNGMAGKFDFMEGYNVDAAKIVKPGIGKLPLAVVGGFRRMRHMEDILEAGIADLVSMSRPFIREPFLVRRFREGKADTAGCVSCNKCLAAISAGMPLRCYYKGDEN